MRFRTPADVAEIAHVSKNRILQLCHQSLDIDRDEETLKLRGVLQTETGRFLIPVDGIDPSLRPRKRR